MSKILVAGSLNADLVVRAPRFPQPGETLSGEDLQIIPGGKGANQAVAAARLGAKVSMLGCVGKDRFGDFLLDTLKTNGVETSLVRRDDASTGTAIILVDANGQNSIVLSAGANGKVSPSDVEHASFATFSLLLLQLEIPVPTVLSAARRAKENNVRVILNPAPARELPAELITLADYLVPNESELALLSGMRVDDIPSAEKAARSLLSRGANQVIVTLGDKGALLVNHTQTLHVKAYSVKAVDTTAAGDAFIGGMAYSLLQNKPLEEALRYGCACGALAVTKFGAQPSLPSRDEVERFMAAQIP
ncbi:MAG TPA: ribokinase [Anaerolineales bacterium]|nr:ribokinase [Anaerolineales bacterium]